ncbi:hypothetical protein BG000_002852 [Podila horticola]|nr:hypothetical protein BG000_002852 [Podila horticola]
MGIYFDDAIAVILNDGVLEIILPFPIVLDVVLALFERYSAVHTLHIRDLFWGDSRHVLQGIPGRLPSLQYLDMDLPGVHGDELVDFLQDPRLRLSELKLWELCPRFHRSSVRPWLLSADSRVWPNSLHRTLTGLDIGGDDEFDMALLLEVLATCVNLQDLHAYGVTTDGLELETSPPWMCKLRELRLGIESYDERPVPTKFALSFMKQLGLQTDLSLLVLRFDDGENTVCDSPFLQLTVDRKRGLGLLSRLAKLETFEMTPTILDIPHVVTTITRSLSFSDLLSCLLINHAWHDAVVPDLYRDAITFRSPRKMHHFGAASQYRYYFRTVPEQQALFKYSRHIRALTCRGKEILSVLVDTDCTNLVEVNFLVDKRRYAIHNDTLPSSTIGRDPVLNTSPVGLANLAKLISRNVNLRAVSIEDLVIATEHDLQELRTFVDFLDRFPLIGCFYLAGELMEDELKVPLKEIWEQRQAAIDSSKILSLSIKQPGGLSRSRRGPPSSKGRDKSDKWPGRKEAQPISYSDFKWHFPRGRWEEDGVGYRAPSALRPPSCTVLAVLESSGALEVCLPSLIFEESIEGLIKRFSRIQRFQTAALHCHEDNFLLGALPGNLPHLCELDMQTYSLRKNRLGWFLNDPQMTLSSVSLRETLPVRYRTSSPLYFLPGGTLNNRDYLHKVMVNLNVGKTTLTMAQVFQVLGQCPNLLNLKVLGAVITGPDGAVECPSWTCKLRTLYLGLYIEGERCDMGRWESRNLSTEDNIRRSTAAACRVAPLFMEQLGLQTDLEELDLNFNQKHSPAISPFLRLDMDPKQGLDQLSRLGKLVSFGALGILHQVGQQEIEWMARHWPRLRILALSTRNVEGGERLVLSRTGQLVEPQFWQWLPHLRTRVGFVWYTCPCCNEAPVRAKTSRD